jgi:hypothetical protein
VLFFCRPQEAKSRQNKKVIFASLRRRSEPRLLTIAAATLIPDRWVRPQLPIAQATTHADTTYFTGLVNARQRQRRKVEALQEEAVELTEVEPWNEVADVQGRVLTRL